MSMSHSAGELSGLCRNPRFPCKPRAAALGADPVLFAEAVDKDYLPKARARGRKGEYEQVTFAFRDLIQPHIDEPLARKVLDKSWLPEMKGR